MTDYLLRACEYLGVERDQVVKSRINDDDFVIIVDKGIAGSPKYRIPLSMLETPKPKPEPEPKPEAQPEPEPELQAVSLFDESDYLDDLSYRELQELAKEAGIPANQSADDLKEALYDLG